MYIIQLATPHNLCESQEKKYKTTTTHTSLASSTLNKRNVMNSLTSLPHQLQAESGFPRLDSIFLVSSLLEICFILKVASSVFLSITGFGLPLYGFSLFLDSISGFKAFITTASASVSSTFKIQLFGSVT